MKTKTTKPKKYESYEVVVTSNGAVVVRREINGKLSEAKKVAIDLVGNALDRSYGRGEHSASVYGMDLVDTITPDERKVGFGPRYEWKRREELFSF